MSHETELSSFLLGTWHTLLRLVSMESQEHLEGIAALTASFKQLSAASTSQEAALRQNRASIKQLQVRCRLHCASTVGSFQVLRCNHSTYVEYLGSRLTNHADKLPQSAADAW